MGKATKTTAKLHTIQIILRLQFGLKKRNFGDLCSLYKNIRFTNYASQISIFGVKLNKNKNQSTQNRRTF